MPFLIATKHTSIFRKQKKEGQVNFPPHNNLWFHAFHFVCLFLIPKWIPFKDRVSQRKSQGRKEDMDFVVSGEKNILEYS